MQWRWRRGCPASLFAVMLLWSGAASAQQPIAAQRIDGTPYYALEPVLRALGYLHSTDPRSVTVSTPAGVLTLFAGAPDGLWRAVADGGASDVSFAGPVEFTADGWFVPADVLDFLGIVVEDDALLLPDGRRLAIAFPVAATTLGAAAGVEHEDLGNGVIGLRFFVAGPAGPHDLSLLVIDLGLLPLAFPEQRRALDAVLAELERDRPLYFVVTSLSANRWEPIFVLEQGERTFEARHPFRVRILDGDPANVSPDSPVVGVILLPEAFRLDAPLGITWGGVASEITFRR